CTSQTSTACSPSSSTARSAPARGAARAAGPATPTEPGCCGTAEAGTGP
ncbi:MAG: hypothetical protein AVDCRST_MAG34-1594, partial [uncultured Nocardioidaceae bacterium]